jgi:hypothetical protein
MIGVCADGTKELAFADGFRESESWADLLRDSAAQFRDTPSLDPLSSPR